jgi:threonine dehydratase
MLSILQARRRLRGRIRRTPLVRSAWLSRLCQADVWLKLESQQETHAFKIRGALNAVLERIECRATPRLVTASAGNHGLALAEAARRTRLDCTIFVPRTAPRNKIEAIRASGATLDAGSPDYDTAEAAARAHAREIGALFVSGYNNPAIVAGAGTIGLEIVEDAPDIDLVAIPVGGGGLASGVATVVKTLLPTCRVVGVEAAANPALRVAREHGRITPIVPGDSLADGLVGNMEEGSITYPIANRFVDDFIDVDEAHIASAIVHLLGEERLVVEGAGAVAIAALASGRLDASGRRVVAIVSGGNIDRETLARLLLEANQ